MRAGFLWCQCDAAPARLATNCCLVLAIGRQPPSHDDAEPRVGAVLVAFAAHFAEHVARFRQSGIPVQLEPKSGPLGSVPRHAAEERIGERKPAYQSGLPRSPPIARGGSQTILTTVVVLVAPISPVRSLELSARAIEVPPYARGSPREDPTIARASSPSGTSPAVILIVDDEATMRDLLSRMLEREGFSVTSS